MAQRKKLLEVTYHYDTDTGMYRVGEIDFGIVSSELEDYIRQYGIKGRDEIVNTLSFLTHCVYKAADEFEDALREEAAEGNV